MMPRRDNDRYRRAPMDWSGAEELGVQAGLVDMLTRDNSKLREAGCNLADAAGRVVRDYDGLHRLSLAIGIWYSTLAGLGDRDTKHAASRIDARRGETPKSGSISEADESLTAASGDAQPPAPAHKKEDK